MSTARGGRTTARNQRGSVSGGNGGVFQTVRWGGLGILAWLAIAALVYFTIVAPSIVIIEGHGKISSLPMFFLTAAVALVVAAYLGPRGWRWLRASTDTYMQEELLGEMRPRMREFRYSLHMMRKSTLTMVGLAIIIFYVFIAIFGPYIAPFSSYAISLNEHHVAPGTGALDTESSNAATATTATWANASYAIRSDGNYASSNNLSDTLVLGGFGPALHFTPATVTTLDVGVKYYSVSAVDPSTGDLPNVSVSWDGGTTWSQGQVAPLKTADDGKLWYLSFANAHAWDAQEVNETGVSVRITHVVGAASSSAVLYVDNVQLRVTFLGPTHPLGTNEYGQDVLAGLLLGTGVDMRIGILVIFGAVAIGIVLGVFSGYLGKGFDEAIMRITDMFLAVPGLILALAFAAVLGRSLDNILIALMLVSWPGYTRLIRGQVLSAREVSYVEAARAVGAPTRRIVMRHILPNVIAPVIVAATLDLGTIVISTAALSFIGLGAQPFEPEWGVMISRGYHYMISGYWWEFLPPGIAILMFVLAFNLFGDGIRDILDPRLRR